MLSVIIPTNDSERTLVQTLAALVPGATAGLVREVIVADGGSRDGTATVADIAGCHLIVSEAPPGQRLHAAAAEARSSWLLFIEPGVVPDSTWVAETRRFVEDAELQERMGQRAAAFQVSADPEGAGESLRQAVMLLLAALGLRQKPHTGLVISKELYERVGGHRAGDTSLSRRLGRRHLVLLRCKATTAEH